MRHLIFICLLFSTPLLAVIEGHKYPFSDPKQSHRFQELNEQLRCPKCQNQNLADSNSPVARDLRNKVYELMQAGKDDEQIVNYMVARYGEFVRYQPALNRKTLLLWGLPALFLGLGIVLIIAFKPKKTKHNEALSQAQTEQLNKLKQQAGVKTK